MSADTVFQGRMFAYRMITTFITTLFESFEVELAVPSSEYTHKMVYTPLFGSRELVSEVMIKLRRREVPF